jgi:hypothetical protein
MDNLPGAVGSGVHDGRGSGTVVAGEAEADEPLAVKLPRRLLQQCFAGRP